VTVVAVVGGVSTTFTATVSGVLVGTTMSIVTGDLQTLTPGVPSATLQVQLLAGAAPLSGVTVSWFTTSGTLTPASGITTTDVNGKASVTVTISSAGTFNVTASFAAVAQYTASSVVFTENSTIAAIPALATNEVAVAIALDNACADLQVAAVLTPAEQDLLNQCLALAASSGVSPTAVADAIEEMLPDVAETQTQTSQVAVTAQYDNLKGRMVALRNGASGISFGGLTLTGSGGSIPVLGLGAALMDQDAPPKNADTFSRWGLFVSGNIGRGDSDATSITPKYDFDVNGITVGVDYRKSDHLVIGGALGYTSQNTNLAASQGSVDMNGFSISGYASWYHESSWYLDSSMTFEHDNYDHSRRILYTLPLPGGGSTTVDEQAKASSGSSDFSLAGTFGRDFHKDAWQMGVYGRLLYSRLSFDAFSEHLTGTASGSGLGLRVDSRDVTSLSSVLGGKVDYTYSTNWGVLMPHAQLEWQKEYKSDPEAFTAFLLNDPTNTPITVVGDSIDSSYFKLGLGLSMVMTKGRSGFFLYERTLARDGISQNNLSLGFRIEF
jgi:outer membrane autotransporter protein